MIDSVTQVNFLIFPGFPMACLTSLIEPLRAANEICGRTAFAWDLVSETDERVSSSAEVKFDPTRQLAELGASDFLILLSPPTAEFVSEKSAPKLRFLSRHGTRLGAVSGGVFPLVRSGLVGNDVISVHWCYDTAFRSQFPKAKASDQLVEIGPNLVTASGAAAAFDLALHIIDRDLGDQIATEVACWFQHPMMRRTGVPQAVPLQSEDQSGTTLPPLVAQAVQLFTNDLSNPMPISEIAEALGVSPRHVERSFKKATGSNPTSYFRDIRMKAARQIVLYSNDRISEIAAVVGYNSLKSFNLHYQNAFGMTPAKDRQRINLYRVKGNVPVPSV
ncbi:GlxA family transcriptional regulator [Pacificoceanicola onchidii]|uniref:GlxA family transcriptional regulator n=1 Tax=Pacificoceanicola onchidii TaxID=2562685 RepID=UPI0010A317DF|nr:helix-turn-helix domain-containing protein [Pacificoceanicola onchidii]